ncbi:MAG: tetratricopeptide repeat protein [Candidatus Gastranaerophilales bacterium]|nr:tetratricopeptide repeat protein [Candidatus Gastranaerophilales bacterium]
MSNLEILHQKAASLYEEKELKDALKIYEDIIKINPADEVALSCVMDIYLELDDKFNYYLARANVNIASGKIEYAINDTKKALDINIDDIDARRKLARLYKIDGKNLKSIDEFLKLLAFDEADLDAAFELVDLYMKEDSLESAISIAKKAYEMNQDNPNVKNMLAQLYFKADDYSAALEVVEDELLKIKILLQDNKNQEADELLKKVDVNKLNDLQKRNYRILKAQQLYNNKKYDEALCEIENYVKENGPDPVSFQMKALIFEEKNDEFSASLNWGFCKKLRGKFDEAIVEFTNAYHKNPTDKTVLIELANLYQNNKERFVAIEFWEKVYALDKDEQAREILAEFYYSEGNFDKAEQYGKAIEKKEENIEGVIDKIMAFFQKKDKL